MSKVVLVTGASSGIGKAISITLSQGGYKVFGASRSVETGTLVDGVTQLQLDVTNELSITKALSYIKEKEGSIDVLVNNAGLGMIGALESTSARQVEEVFQTNVYGVLNMCRAVIPFMREQKRGTIINVTSIAGLMGLPFRGIYSASKSAVEGFSEALSAEVNQFGIKVIIIEPGDFKTNINENRRVAEINTNIYEPFQSAVIAQVNKEVQNAPDPALIGEALIRILKKQNPRLRYKVATPFQRFSVLIRDIIPDRWFEKLVKRYYKM
ncbi:MAG: SDR family oxidoreductase [Flavobacteriales bacterium]|jgi:NAD(P)-dependent dehydrogenase (short-subunit alcohol dehydrogenase family)